MNPQGVRNKVATEFGRALDDVDLGRKIEIVLYNDVLRSCKADKIPLEWSSHLGDVRTVRERYTQRAINLLVFNLKKNAALRHSLKTNEVTPKKFVAMLPWERDPAMWDPIFDRVAKKALGKQLGLSVEDAPDGFFECRKCKSKKTTYYQMQTRSADEPMTTFVQCLACKARWKC